MNAAALLASQGWRGKGHSLHKSSDDIGLANPLLLNRKSDKKGIGNTQHFTSDQWWMNAFDEQLAGLDTSKKGKVTQTVQTGKINQFEKGSVAKYSLYSTFVSGGFLQGTIKTLDDEPTSTSTSDSDSDALEKSKKATNKKESKEEKKARKETKRRRKEEKALIEALKASKKSKSDSSDEARELKKQRRAKKEERRKQRRETNSEK